MRRGAGHRGGRGMAGVKKHQKSYFLTKDPSALVDKGPGRPPAAMEPTSALNIRSLEEQLENLLDSGMAEKKKKKIHVDISQLGYDKLLGGGLVRNPWVVKADKVSKTARRKIEEAGGEVIIRSDESS